MQIQNIEEVDNSQVTSIEDPNEDDQQIRISSDGSSPNLQDPRIKSFESKQFELFDKMIESIPDTLTNDVSQQKTIVQSSNIESNSKKLNRSITSADIQRNQIIRQAEKQRIGGTYDFFAYQIGKYGYHMQARKNILYNISHSIDKNKVIKCNAFKMLIQYFKAHASVSQIFHQKCCKLQVSTRQQQSQNALVNIKIQLKSGFEHMANLIKNIGDDMSKIDKFIKANTLPKIDKAIQIYKSTTSSYEQKVNVKLQNFVNKQKTFIKRIDKITKLYTKARIGSEIDEDLFIQMAKFVREEKQLRQLIFDWGVQIFNLRKDMMKADQIFFSELQSALQQFKNVNDSIYQLKNKRSNFIQSLHEQIEQNYEYQRLCSSQDNDYLLSIVSIKNKSLQTIIRQEDYEQFLCQQYFGEIIGDTSQFLKGTLIKIFPTKMPNEELIRTISGNLIYYNKESLQMIKKMKVPNTIAQFEGDGCVLLKQTAKGVLFTRQEILKIYFTDNDRAEELILYLSTSFGNDLQ